MSVFSKKDFRLASNIIKDIITKEEISSIGQLIELLDSKGYIHVNENFIGKSNKLETIVCPECGTEGIKYTYKIDGLKIIRCPAKCGWSNIQDQ